MSDMNDRILLMRGGGTIDSVAYEDPHNPPKFVDTLKGDDSLIMRTVAGLPHGDKVDGLSWGTWDENRFVKDSQKYTQSDAAALADLIKADSRRYFILTCGTDAMAHIGTMLQEELKGTDKVVVLTGGMVPLSMADKHPSDAVPGLQFTLEYIREQKPGVCVVGRDAQTKRLAFFDPTTVEKNKEQSMARLEFTFNRR